MQKSDTIRLKRFNRPPDQIKRLILGDGQIFGEDALLNSILKLKEDQLRKQGIYDNDSITAG